MSTQCPLCQSTHISSKNYGRKIGGTVGTTAGTVGGVTTALSALRWEQRLVCLQDLLAQSCGALAILLQLVAWWVELQAVLRVQH